MSTQTLIESMEKLLSLHQDLYETALEKTEALQNNDVEALTKLLREEQKMMVAIKLANNKREQAVALLTNGDKETTISEIIETLDGENRDKLLDLQMKLSELLSELQNTNALNQQLLQYSLQFIHLNLDLLSPEPELPNYTKTQTEASDFGTSRSVFDSKA